MVGLAAKGLIGGVFERHDVAAPPAAVGGDHSLDWLSLMRSRRRIGGEAAEDDRVDRADAGAGQHGDRGFGDHRQVDGDAVALRDAQAQKHVGELADLAVQVPIGQDALIARLAFEDDRGFVAARAVQVPVQAVGGDVELPAEEPLGVGRVPFADRIPRLCPVQKFPSLFSPPASVGRRLPLHRLGSLVYLPER